MLKTSSYVFLRKNLNDRCAKLARHHHHHKKSKQENVSIYGLLTEETYLLPRVRAVWTNYERDLVVAGYNITQQGDA
jgi:hypothetical protein